MMINCDDSLPTSSANGGSVLNRLACFVSVRNVKTECGTSLACFNALKANVAATAAMLR